MCLQPLVDAVHVEVMPALPLDRGAIFSRVFTLRTRHFKGIHADHTVGVANVPVPSCHGEPTVYCYLHFSLKLI